MWLQRLPRFLFPVIVLLLTGCANRLFFFPDRIDYQSRYLHPILHEDVWIPNKKGESIHGWFLPAQGDAKATVLFLHGNAQNLTAHVLYIEGLVQQGFNVFAIDYRGYGFSGGHPSRKNALQDAQLAYQYLRQRKDIDPDKLILYGQSLGGAIALTLAGREHLPGLKAVIADSAFSNYGRIGREKMLQIPVLGYMLWPLSPLLISSGLSPDKTVNAIAPTPLLLIHGTMDSVVPLMHSQRLFRQAKMPAALWELQGAGHTEALGRYRAQIMPLLNQYLEAALGLGDASALTQNREFHLDHVQTSSP